MKKQIEGQYGLFDFTETESFIAENADKSAAFKECAKCWCMDCCHNERNEAIPRNFAGEAKPCPACKFCIEKGKADICEIGSYDNGCKLRASEDGIYLEQ